MRKFKPKLNRRALRSLLSGRWGAVGGPASQRRWQSSSRSEERLRLVSTWHRSLDCSKTTGRNGRAVRRQPRLRTTDPSLDHQGGKGLLWVGTRPPSLQIHCRKAVSEIPMSGSSLSSAGILDLDLPLRLRESGRLGATYILGPVSAEFRSLVKPSPIARSAPLEYPRSGSSVLR